MKFDEYAEKADKPGFNRYIVECKFNWVLIK